MRQLRRELHSSDFGEVQYLTARRLNLGLHRPDVDVIWDLGPHDISICTYLLGVVPEWVQASGVTGVDGKLETAFVNLGFQGGVGANLVLSWRAPRKVRDFIVVGGGKMAIYDEGDDDEPIRIVDRGVAYDEGPDYAPNRMTYRFGSTYAPAVPMREPLQVQLLEFLAYARGESDDFVSPVTFGREVVRCLEAASRSVETGGSRIFLGGSDA